MIRLVLLRLLESYFRHRWLYFVPIILMLCAAFLFISRQESKYLASGILYVQKESFLASLTSVRDNNIGWWITPADDSATEISDLIRTDAFVRAVVQSTDLEEKIANGPESVRETINEARQSIWITTLGDNQVVINAGHTDAQIAYQLVNSVLDSYLQWKINADRVESEVARAFFVELTQQYKDDLEATRHELQEYMLSHPQPVRGDRPEVEQLEIERLQAELQLAGTRYARALEKDENARLALSQTESDIRQTYFLLDAPRIPSKPETSLKDTVMNVAIFVVVGVFMSGVGVMGSALIDRSFRFPVDIHHLLDLPVLAAVPNATVGHKWYQFRKRRKVKTARRDVQHKQREAVPQRMLDKNGHNGTPGKVEEINGLPKEDIRVEEPDKTQQETKVGR